MIKIIMFEKLEELAKNNKKISDFHIRSGSPLAYRQTGEIIMVKDVMVKPQDLIDMLTTNCNEHETKRFQDTHELELSCYNKWFYGLEQIFTKH